MAFRIGRHILMVLAGLWAVAAAQAQAQDAAAAPAAKELTALLETFLDGASRNDIKVHERFWADDLIYTRSAGARTSKAGILEGMRAGAESPDEPPVTYSAEDVVIHQYGDTAVVAFRLVGKTGGARPAAAHYLNTGTFIRRNGEWRAVAWQATKVPEAGEQAPP